MYRNCFQGEDHKRSFFSANVIFTVRQNYLGMCLKPLRMTL